MDSRKGEPKPADARSNSPASALNYRRIGPIVYEDRKETYVCFSRGRKLGDRCATHNGLQVAGVVRTLALRTAEIHCMRKQPYTPYGRSEGYTRVTASRHHLYAAWNFLATTRCRELLARAKLRRLRLGGGCTASARLKWAFVAQMCHTGIVYVPIPFMSIPSPK